MAELKIYPVTLAVIRGGWSRLLTRMDATFYRVAFNTIITQADF